MAGHAGSSEEGRRCAGCMVDACGVKGRRRTWLAARSAGELLASVEPAISEWGNPARVMPRDCSLKKRAEASPGTETSQYREEQTSTEIPQVVASERGAAQTDSRAIPVTGCVSGVDSRTGREVTLRGGSWKKPDLSRTTLEGAAEGGESPVGEGCGLPAVRARVPRDTRNPVGSWGDHPPRLNTLDDR
jgi:hypothetical protein